MTRLRAALLMGSIHGVVMARGEDHGPTSSSGWVTEDLRSLGGDEIAAPREYWLDRPRAKDGHAEANELRQRKTG